MNIPSSLCPGYRNIDTFALEEEYESDEEVCYVTLDLGDVEPKLVPSSNSYRLIGLDTSTPFLQIQGTVLRGRHDLLLGSELLFTDDKNNHDWNRRSVTHVANTEQRIAFTEVTLVPKLSSNAVGKQKAFALDNADDNAGDMQLAETDMNFDLPASSSATAIDLMTGLTAPPPRATRTRKASLEAGSGSRPTTRKPRKTKDPLTATKRPARGKGKEQETLPIIPTPQPPHDEGGLGDDDLDDIYMDAE